MLTSASGGAFFAAAAVARTCSCENLYYFQRKTNLYMDGRGGRVLPRILHLGNPHGLEGLEPCVLRALRPPDRLVRSEAFKKSNSVTVGRGVRRRSS